MFSTAPVDLGLFWEHPFGLWKYVCCCCIQNTVILYFGEEERLDWIIPFIFMVILIVHFHWEIKAPENHIFQEKHSSVFIFLLLCSLQMVGWNWADTVLRCSLVPILYMTTKSMPCPAQVVCWCSTNTNWKLPFCKKATVCRLIPLES